MKVVIEVAKEVRDYIIEHELQGIMAEAIAHGTPLPEHHGRLIDADELKTIRSIQNKYANFNSIETIQEWIDHAPTIIEADKEDD